MSQQGMRTFSTEFKQTVALRLEAGGRIAAVSEELKIRRKLLYEWRAAYRKFGVVGLNRKRDASRAALAPVRPLRRLRRLRCPTWREPRRRSPSSNARSASSRWTSIFFAKPCGSSTRGIGRLARRHLRGHRRNDCAGDARRPLDRASHASSAACRAPASIALARFVRPSVRKRICATKSRRSRSKTASTAIGGSAGSSGAFMA